MRSVYVGKLRTMTPVLLLTQRICRALIEHINFRTQKHLSNEMILNCPRLLNERSALLSGNSPEEICQNNYCGDQTNCNYTCSAYIYLYSPARCYCAIKKSIRRAQHSKLPSFPCMNILKIQICDC